MRIRKDNRILLVGERFNDWTVIEEVRLPQQASRHYLCRCICSYEKIINASTLKGGKSSKCRDCAFKIHGMSKTNTYRIWSDMLSRCYNPNATMYRYYGGRGIEVSEEWRKDFMEFYKDMGARPKGLQLDRIDNDKGYFKENCRWTTPKENNPYNKGDIKDDMPGKTLGKWLVLHAVKHKPGHRYYLCRCACGTEKIKSGGELRKGRATQCLNCKNISHRGWGERYRNARV